MSTKYDVIIIGSGAGGGTLARHLAPSGKSILILERGDWLTREQQNWDAEEVFIKNRYVPKETWYDKTGKPFQPGLHYFVGGATKMFGAALYRLRKEDFGELKHYDGISPAWPIDYEEMEPYYTKAEQMYQVHGARGEDPTEPPSSAPYPFPAVSHEPRIQQLHDDLARAGYRPFHAPCGVMLPSRASLLTDRALRIEHAQTVHGVQVVLVGGELEQMHSLLRVLARAAALEECDGESRCGLHVAGGRTLAIPAHGLVLVAGHADTGRIHPAQAIHDVGVAALAQPAQGLQEIAVIAGDAPNVQHGLIAGCRGPAHAGAGRSCRRRAGCCRR